MSYDERTGASLYELYKGGAVELPLISGAFTAAQSGYNTLSVDAALSRHDELGLDGRGPTDAIYRLLQELAATAGHTRGLIDDVAANVVRLAQELARTDQEVRAEFTRLGGEL